MCAYVKLFSIDGGAAAEPLSEHPAHRGAKSSQSTGFAHVVLRICPEKCVFALILGDFRISDGKMDGSVPGA